MANLSQTVADRLRAGALVVIVQEADELLALSAVEAGVAACKPVKVVSASDPEAVSALEGHAEGSGSLVLLDGESIRVSNRVVY